MGRTRNKFVHWPAFTRVKDMGGRTLCDIPFGYSYKDNRNFEARTGKTLRLAGKSAEITCRGCLAEAARMDAERSQRFYAQSHCPI